MNEQVIKLMFELLRYEISQTELLEATKAKITPELLLQLYSLSKRHDLAHLIADALDKNGLLPDDSEVSIKFQKQQMMAIYRYERINYELNMICETLEAAEIPFIPLKGSVIRKYYPEPWMRTSCDIDVLVREEDLHRATVALTEKMRYKNQGRGSHDVSYFSPSGVHVELHYDLVEDGRANAASKILLNVWKEAVLSDSCKFFYQLTDPMFYFYHIAHMAKHFEMGGCGVRTFLDLWILDHQQGYDEASRDVLLKQGGLLTFANACRKLSDMWFSDRTPDEICIRMQDYLLYGGTYGNLDNRVAVQQNKRGGKFKYALSRIFLPYETIKCHYPILKKHRWLTPFYEVRRWFNVLLRGKMKRSLHELNLNQSITKEQRNQTAELFDNLGL